MRRVAITGAGAISALGRNTSEFAEALREGRGGIGQIESTDITVTAFSERRRGEELHATSPTSKTGARISWTASRSSR